MRSSRAWYAVAVLGLVYFVAFADRLALSLLVEPIRAELHVSDTQMGFLFGLSFALTLVAFSLPFGWLADRFDRRWLIAITVAVWGLLTAASGLARTFPELLLCRVGVGIGEAGLSPTALSMISDFFPSDRRSAPVSAYLTAGIAGATGSFLVLGMLLGALTPLAGTSLPIFGSMPVWRTTLVILGVPTLLLSVLIALTVVEPVRETDQKPKSAGEAIGYLGRRAGRYGPMFLAFGLMALLSIAASAWYPTYLIRNLGLPAHDAGIAFGAAAITGGVSGSFLVPMALDALNWRSGRDAVAALGGSVSAIGCVAFFASLVAGALSLKMMLMALANFCFIGGINIPAVELQRVGPPHLRAQLAALYFMFVNICGLGTGPLVAAAIASYLPDSRHALGSALEILCCAVAIVSLPALVIIGWRSDRQK